MTEYEVKCSKCGSLSCSQEKMSRCPACRSKNSLTYTEIPILSKT